MADAAAALMEAQQQRYEARVRALITLAKASQKKKNRKEVLAALILWFSTPGTIKELVGSLVSLGISRAAAVKAVKLVAGKPLPRSSSGPVAKRVAEQEPKLRAEYLLSAAERLSDGEAEKTEEHHLEQHLQAGENRARAAKKTDAAFKQASVVVWRCVMDERTDARCAVLNGRLFTVNSLPGVPGAMHPRCRCTVEPVGNGPLIDWGAS